MSQMSIKTRKRDVRSAVKNSLFSGLIGLSFFLSSGCATVGHYFPVEQIPEIIIGQTTQDDVREMFGSPWRVGVEDEDKTWTYGRYQYRLFSAASTQDLVIRFNDRNIVESFTYNTTEHEE